MDVYDVAQEIECALLRESSLSAAVSGGSSTEAMVDVIDPDTGKVFIALVKSST